MVQKSAGTSTPKPKKRPRVDWEAVERDYRTGTLTLRELQAKHGPNNGTIARRAEREGWTKDLSAAVRQATNALVIAQTVQQECSTAQQNTATAVLAAAEVAKSVILGQRARVGRATEVAMRMLDELDATTTKAADLGALFDILAGDLDDRALADARAKFADMMKLHTRVGSAQKLMDALNKAQVMERQAFGLDENPDQEKDALTELLHTIASGNASTVKPVHDDPELED